MTCLFQMPMHQFMKKIFTCMMKVLTFITNTFQFILQFKYSNIKFFFYNCRIRDYT